MNGPTMYAQQNPHEMYCRNIDVSEKKASDIIKMPSVNALKKWEGESKEYGISPEIKTTTVTTTVSSSATIMISLPLLAYLLL